MTWCPEPYRSGRCIRRHAPSYELLFATLEKLIGQGVVVGYSGEDRSLKDALEVVEMPRCRCGKKMRLRSDGWKRCYRCGKECMGLALRIELGRRMAMEDSIPEPVVCEPVQTSTYVPRRIAVAWRSTEPHASQGSGDTARTFT